MGPHFERGQVLFDLKRYREAVEAYQAELAANPDAAVVHAMIAAALINLRKVRDAGRAVRRALELAPDMAYAHYILSFVHQRRQCLADAEKAIAEAIRLEQSPEIFHQWAIIAEQRGKFPEALAATGHSLQLAPWHSPSILLRGKLLAREGRLDESHALFVTALSHNPQDAAAQHALGSLQLRSGDAVAALGTLREARRLDPVTANDARAIALAYGRMIWPLRFIDRFVFRWHRLSPKKRWCLFTLLAVLLVLGGTASSDSLGQDMPGPIWMAICIAVANYFVLPFSFDMLAGAVGYFALRHEFRPRWYSLILRPLVLFPALSAHLGATLLGLLISMPSLAVMTCLLCASFPLLSASVQAGPGRLTGWICVPLLFLLMIFGTLGALLLLESAIVAVPVLAIVFSVALFSDDIARWIASWRFRRNLHLLETPS